MNVWTIRLGENLSPLDGPSVRPNRAISVARALVAKGHEVTYWTSSMSHYLKRERCKETSFLRDDHGVRLNVLWAPPYNRNISLQRIKHHRATSVEFSRWAPELPRPDIIVSSYPTAEVTLECYKFAHPQGIPVVLDVRDMWPDIFLDLVPKAWRWGARLALQPLFAQAARCFREADAIAGITDEIVDWGVKRGARVRGVADRAFHLAYYTDPLPDREMQEADNYWSQVLPPSKMIIAFIGTFFSVCELRPVLEAARRIPPEEGITFVLAGTGEQEQEIREAAMGCERIICPGWIDAPKLRSLLNRTGLGLLPYPSRRDFALSLPNKVGEYLSAGVPIVSSVQGVLSRFLQEHECGWTYRNKDAAHLAEIILKLHRDRDLFEKARAQAHKSFESHFDAKQVYSNMANWIISLGEGRVRE